MPSSFVLGSLESSTYPRGYASGSLSPRALLEAILTIPLCYPVPDSINARASYKSGCLKV